MMGLKSVARIVAAAIMMVGCGWGVWYLISPAYDGNVGIAYGKAYAPERDTHVNFHIWYPALPGGRLVTVGGNGVFYGTEAGHNAPHKSGRFPLVLISHGAGGNAGQFGWIASTLAENGYVVVLPNHPGSTSRNASAEEAVKLWKRPADISAVIDAIEIDPAQYSYVDTSAISALGFSAGGYTAMAVSGAIIDPVLLENFCDDGQTGMSDCAFLARGGVNLHEMDLSPAGKDHRDPRIKAAVIIDPGTVTTLTPDSLKAIDIPMLIINLGDETDVPHAVYARAAADTIPNAIYITVPDAIHFSFLAECKAKGRQILIDEGEGDPLCDDAGGRSRAALHNDLNKSIVGYLDRRFQR